MFLDQASAISVVSQLATEAEKSHLFKVMWLDGPELGTELLSWSSALVS